MTLKLRREHYVRLYLEVNSVLKNQDAGTKILDEFPRPTCRSVYTVSDKHLRHGGSGYETTQYVLYVCVCMCVCVCLCVCVCVCACVCVCVCVCV